MRYIKSPLVLGLMGMLVVGFAAAQQAQADTVIALYGSGNGNDDWTTDTNTTAGVQTALRAHVRYDTVNNQPQNVQNWDGVDTYSHAAGAPSFAPTRGRWNVDWSVDLTGSGYTIGDLTYVFGYDSDPSQGESFTTFDEINDFALRDHSFGDSSTANGAGVEATNTTDYATYLGQYTIAQNSVNYGFLTSLFTFDPNVDATYTVFLEAYAPRGTSPLSRTQIYVVVGNGGDPVAVPLPPAAFAGLGLLAGLGALRRRRRNQQKA